MVFFQDQTGKIPRKSWKPVSIFYSVSSQIIGNSMDLGIKYLRTLYSFADQRSKFENKKKPNLTYARL
jgi:hypothetical protein